MTPNRWEQITEIYTAALELKSGERIAFLNEICAGDGDLRREVESLLAANSEAGDFIDKPVAKNIASVIKTEETISLVGKNLGQYEIISRLGAGGMGEVFLAKDTRLNRSVALKTLPVSLSKHPNYLKRFQIEAEAAATLNHPNVATIYSVEEVDGQPFITMEYVEGKTLDRLIPSDGLDLKIFLEWFIEISDALSHAHEKGIVHRDIKPGNIIITASETPKILDFGLAQIERETISENTSTLKMTHPGQVIGTPAYMSPEQAEGKEIDARTDIFSLGVVMYEAITGKRPFTGDNYFSIIGNLLKTEPESISEIKPDTPYLLARLINRCLGKSRRHRFQTMREVRVILEEIKAAVEAGISMDSSSSPLLVKQKQTSRNWLLFTVFPIFLILGVISAYFFLRQNSVPPIEFENMAIRKLSQTNNVVYAHITPDGKSVAYNSIENGNRALWIRRIEDKNSLQLLPFQSVHFWGGLTISADASQIYYINAQKDGKFGTLFRISSLGGTPRKLVETVNDLGSLSTDEKRVLYVRYAEKVQLLSANAADGSDEKVIQTGDANHLFRDPHFSHDGKKIFLIKFERISGEEFWSLIEIPAEGGAERVILPPQKPKISEIAVLKDGSGLLVNNTDEISNLPQIFFVDIESGEKRRVTNDLNSYFGISVSDDGKTIVTAQRFSATDVWISTDKNLKDFKKLTSEPTVYSQAVLTPNDKIIYDATDNNRPHIWIMNADGSDPQQLTPNNSSDYNPLVSADGRYIIFVSERSGEIKLWRMNIDGSNPQILAKVSGRTAEAVISPDSKYVYFSWFKDNDKVLGRIPIEGGEVTEQPRFTNRFWDISPDGKQIAYPFYDETEKANKVAVRPIDSDKPLTVFNISPTKILIWKKDGKSLLYQGIEPDENSIWTIWEQPISGGEPKPFLQVKSEMISSLSQSKDESKTVVVRGQLLTDAVMLTKIK